MTREEAIKQSEDFIKHHSDWSVEVEWANGVRFILEDYKRLIEQEPKTGHWIKEKSLHGWDGKSYQCSECGRSIHLDLEVEDLNDYPYCHCGARMIEPQESEDKE